jgi:hypothetical protein
MNTAIITAILLGFTTMQGLKHGPGGSSATYVDAEVVKGNLSPAKSKPGDEITLKLNEDLKSNGNIVLKKGSIITGIVRRVKSVEGKNESTQLQSLIEIQWLTPASPYAGSQDLMVAVQSLSQHSLLARQQTDNDGDASPPVAPSAGALNGPPGVTGSFVHQSNAALLRMPSVVEADPKTVSVLHTNLGMSDDQQLFQTGHGQIVTPGGFKESIDIFSHLNNDTVLAAHTKNFEVFSGAQIQLLVGMRKR